MSYWKPAALLIMVSLLLVVAALTFDNSPRIRSINGKPYLADRDVTPSRFVDLGEFLINLNSDEGSQYLKASITLKLRNPGPNKHIKASIPEIRHHVNLAIQSMTASELATYDGKLKLADRIKGDVETVMSTSPRGPNGTISDVMFTAFIIQR